MGSPVTEVQHSTHQLAFASVSANEAPHTAVAAAAKEDAATGGAKADPFCPDCQTGILPC